MRKVEVELQRRGQLSGWLGSGGKGHQHSTQAWCPQGQLLQVRKGPSDPLGDCVRYTDTECRVLNLPRGCLLITGSSVG